MITIRHKIGFRRSATCIALVTLPLLALAVGVSTAWCDDKIAIQTVNAVGMGSGFKTPATTSCPGGDICYALSGKISGPPVGSASFAANCIDKKVILSENLKGRPLPNANCASPHTRAISAC
jgi:hypothetical protein